MIQRSLNHKYRTAALVGAAVAISTLTSVRAQAQALTNLFSGTQSSTAASVTGAGVGLTTATSGAVGLGSGYTGTVTIPNLVTGTVTETVNAPTSINDFVLSTSGVTTNGTFNANANLPAGSLLPNATYQLSYTTANSGGVNVAAGSGFVLSLGNTAFVNTSSGLGILGVANVLGVLNSGGITTVDFTTPGTLTGASVVNVAFQGNLGVTAGTGAASLIVSGATITQVPEPSTIAPALVGVVGLAFWRARHRSRLG